MTSSNPHTRTNSIEFLELMSMGKKIVPLLINKLLSPNDFFALQAVDRYLGKSLQVNREIEDKLNLLGEQGRATETVKKWIRYSL